jgi:leader peptidase (prepilin peptidase)/N-methyltransferase
MAFFTLSSFEAVLGLPEYFAYIFVFVFGAAIGSFLNVVIHRVPNEESIVFPNSACPKCSKPIQTYDNIPILSWLILRGKCRNCKEPIAVRYPLVELLTAVVFLVVYWKIGFTPYLPVSLTFAAVMISLVFIDAEHMILPNVITYPLLVAALLVRLLFPIFVSSVYFTDLARAPLASLSAYPAWAVSMAGAVLGALAGGGSLWLVGEIWKRLRGVEAMGLGDVKMMLGVGALLGWSLSFLSIFIAAFVGAIAGVALLAGKRDRDLQGQIPFGVFLGPASLIALLFGDQLIQWYLRSFLG